MSRSVRNILFVYNKISGNCKKIDVLGLGHKNALLITRNFHNNNNFLSANVSFNLSDIGEGIREVVVKEWFVKPGDKVSQFDNICEVQSDKASVTITSRYDGIVTKLHYQIDDTALVGKPLIDIETDECEVPQVVQNESTKTEELLEDVKFAETKENGNKLADITFQEFTVPVLCIPSVRRLAKENNIDLGQIKGTGKHGRLLKEDVLKFLTKTNQQNQGISIKPQSIPEVLENRVEPIKAFKKAMLKTMTESLKIPHFVYSDEIKVTKLTQLRKSVNSLPELNSIKLSFMPFFIKAASNALQRYPILNSSLDPNCDNIIYKKDHNIGIAMDTKVGLAVPVIKQVQNLSIMEIATELNRLISSGKSGAFSPSDMNGGTFTISNIGIIGGTYTKPVISPPQVAIIALGASQTVPRFNESFSVIPEDIINLSSAADHRVIDGATMANFVQILKKQIENPTLLFLNL